MDHASREEADHKEIQGNWHIVMSTWLLLSLIAGVAGNSLLVLVILKKGKLRVVSNAFNLNLAAANLIRAAVFTPVYLVYSRTKSWPMGLPGCKFMYLVLYSSFGVTVLTLMCLSWERYKGTSHPLRKQMTVRTALWLVLITWLVALPLSALSGNSSLQLVTKTSGNVVCVIFAKKNTAKALIMSSLVLTQLIPATFFIFTYIKIILKLRRDVVSVNPSGRAQSDINRFRRNKKAVKILLVDIILFMSFLYPFHQFNMNEVFSHGGLVSPMTMHSLFIYCMMVSYSTINPIIHLVLNSDFRKGVLKLANQTKICCCRST